MAIATIKRPNAATTVRVIAQRGVIGLTDPLLDDATGVCIPVADKGSVVDRSVVIKALGVVMDQASDVNNPVVHPFGIVHGHHDPVVVSVGASVVVSVNDPVFHHSGHPFQENVVDAGPVVVYLCVCVPMFIKHLKW